jgi:hypothetical protein
MGYLSQSKLGNWWSRLSATASKPVDLFDYRRFKESHWQQKGVLIMSLLLVLAFFYKEYLTLPKAYMSESDYMKEMEQKAAVLKPEIDEHLIKKGEAVPYNQNVNDYLGLSEQEKIEPTSVSNNEIWQAEPDTEKSPDLYITNDGKTYSEYNCSRLGTNTFYVVQDNIYGNFEKAKQRIDELRKDIKLVSAMSLGCCKKPAKGYVVFFGHFHTTKEEAINYGKYTKSKLHALKINAQNVKVRTIILR